MAIERKHLTLAFLQQSVINMTGEQSRAEIMKELAAYLVAAFPIQFPVDGKAAHAAYNAGKDLDMLDPEVLAAIDNHAVLWSLVFYNVFGRHRVVAKWSQPWEHVSNITKNVAIVPPPDAIIEVFEVA